MEPTTQPITRPPPPKGNFLCQWEACPNSEQIYPDMQVYIEHIHLVHVGAGRNNYTCEWIDCPRKGMGQTSRFALISHIRSHTGEKPFVCPKCEKSFTRSDALSKHIKMVHERRNARAERENDEALKDNVDVLMHFEGTPLNIPTPPPPGTSNRDGAFSSFKVDTTSSLRMPLANPMPVVPPPENDTIPSDSTDLESVVSILPPTIKSHYDPETSLIRQKYTPSQALYLTEKAKYRHQLDVRSKLEQQLAEAHEELRRVTDEKEEAVDAVMKGLFGEEKAARFSRYVEKPVGMVMREGMGVLNGG